MRHLAVHSLWLSILIVCGCAQSPQAGGVPASKPASRTLHDLLKPEWRRVGGPWKVDRATEEWMAAGSCSWECNTLQFEGLEAPNAFLDSLQKATRNALQTACTDIDEADVTPGEGYFSVELGRSDSLLISFSYESTIVYPGGKGHPMRRARQYDPAQHRWLGMADLFTLPLDSLMPILRGKVLKQLEAENLLDNPENVLFDNGAKSTAEVFTDFLVEEGGIRFLFGPAQCYQLSWAGVIEVVLPWDSPIDR